MASPHPHLSLLSRALTLAACLLPIAAAAQTIGEDWEIQAQTRRLEEFYDEARRPPPQ